jgi:hypothetical protein
MKVAASFFGVAASGREERMAPHADATSRGPKGRHSIATLVRASGRHYQRFCKGPKGPSVNSHARKGVDPVLVSP